MNLLEFVLNEGLIMIPALFVIGEFIKSTECRDKYIPLTLLILSIIMTPLVLGGYNIETIVQAILIAGATVFSDQVLKQAKKDE